MFNGSFLPISTGPPAGESFPARKKGVLQGSVLARRASSVSDFPLAAPCEFPFGLRRQDPNAAAEACRRAF